jgi:hypothetical protein
MKKLILILFASVFLISCGNDTDVLPNLSIVMSSPDESTKNFGDTIGVYLGSDLATSINVTITGGAENLVVYDQTSIICPDNGSCTGPGCLDCLAQNNGHPDECGCNECLVKNTDFRFVGSWIPVCANSTGHPSGCTCTECLALAGTSESFVLNAEATNEDGQSGSISLTFLVQH